MKKIFILIISILLYSSSYCDSHALYEPKKYVKRFTSPRMIDHYELENSNKYEFLGEAVDVIPRYEATVIGFTNPFRIVHIKDPNAFFVLETGRGNFLVFKFIDEFGNDVYVCSRKYTTNQNYPEGSLKLHKPGYSKRFI